MSPRGARTGNCESTPYMKESKEAKESSRRSWGGRGLVGLQRRLQEGRVVVEEFGESVSAVPGGNTGAGPQMAPSGDAEKGIFSAHPLVKRVVLCAS